MTDIMDLVRVHGYKAPALTPLKALSRAQGQALMEKVRAKVAGKRSADEVGISCGCRVMPAPTGLPVLHAPGFTRPSFTVDAWCM